MEQNTSGAQVATDMMPPDTAPARSHPRLGIYLVVGFILLVGIVIYLVVGNYIADLLQSLTNFNQ